MSIDLNYVISQTEAYGTYLNNGKAILNVAELLGKRSRNMLVSEMQESAGSSKSEVFSFAYEVDQDGLIRKACAVSEVSEVTMTFKYKK